MTTAEFAALPGYSDSFSYDTSAYGDHDTVELTAAKQPKAPGSFLGLSSHKENAPLLWSQARVDDEDLPLRAVLATARLGGGYAHPIMWSEEFDALPEWSDVEDDPDWNSVTDEVAELGEPVGFEIVVQGRI